MGGPAAATASGAGAAAAQSSDLEDKASYTPVDGKRPEEPEVHVRRERNLEEDVRPQEPLAQKFDIDEPREGGQRDATQQAQAAAENTPPPEQPAHEEAEAQPKGPLPDLRQGIPSTFDMEFGEGKQQQQQQGKKDDGLDLTEEEPETQQRREREEREYDRSAYETSLDRRRAQMANYLYAFIAAAAGAAGVYFSRPFGSREEIPQGLSDTDAASWSPTSMYARLRARMGSQVGYYTEPTFPKLLPDMPENMRPPYTLVLSLEDLMIHSTWDREHGYRTAKRPGIDYFIRYLQQYYELVLFTSVPIAMADPVMRKLDPYHIIQWPLGREATKYDGGDYVKDLAYLNRPLGKTLIIDTNARHVKNQPENSIILPKWTGDPKDPHVKDLVALIPFLEYVATTGTGDVRDVLKSFEGKNIPEEFARREAVARKKFNEQLEAERAKAPKRSLGSLGSALGIKSTPAMSGGMVLADGQSVAEGLKEGKRLSDQIREQGQKQYVLHLPSPRTREEYRFD